jgi:hypothetical protein
MLSNDDGADDITRDEMLGCLERLRDELKAIAREHGGRPDRGHHQDGEIDELLCEVRRLRREFDCCELATPSVGCESGSTSAAPPFPPFPPFPPCPPYPPYPPFPPFPSNSGCCAPARCGCAKCSGRERAPAPQPEPQPTPPPIRPQPSSSSSINSSSSSSARRPIIVTRIPSSSSSIFSTNVR